MNFPRLIYLCRRASDGRCLALRRFGHHQTGEHAGQILTNEATPIVYGGIEYVPKPMFAGDTRPLYTCHAMSSGGDGGSDAGLSDALGLPIEEMG